MLPNVLGQATRSVVLCRIMYLDKHVGQVCSVVLCCLLHLDKHHAVYGMMFNVLLDLVCRGNECRMMLYYDLPRVIKHLGN